MKYLKTFEGRNEKPPQIVKLSRGRILDPFRFGNAGTTWFRGEDGITYDKISISAHTPRSLRIGCVWSKFEDAKVSEEWGDHRYDLKKMKDIIDRMVNEEQREESRRNRDNMNRRNRSSSSSYRSSGDDNSDLWIAGAVMLGL